MFSDPTTPNQPDYLLFLRNGVGIASGVLPDVSDAITTSFSVALETVDDTFLNAATPTLYTLAVYNLAADRLINYALDQPGQTYFQDLRKQFRLNDVSVGVPSSANDQGTAVGILNPEFLKTLTMQDLETLRTPYGRQYMSFALKYGPSLWGVT